MKAINKGYRYELENMEFPMGGPQVIQFIEKKEQIVDNKKVFVTVNNGTTNEEVLEMMIDRMNHQNNKLPSRETSIAIRKIEESLMWLRKRTAERKKRGVEGTPKM